MTSPSPGFRLNTALLIVIAAIAAAVGLWLAGRQIGATAQPPVKIALLYPAPRPIPDFTLTRADGKPLTLADWRGHWSIVYFGYASCPDVCPTTLATFKSAWKQLSERGLSNQVQFDFISVDPERDTPDVLGKYVAFFSPDFIAATGSDDALTALARSVGQMYTRRKTADGAIEVDHSGSAVIVDPQGRLVGIFRPPFGVADLVADVTTLATTKQAAP